MFEQKSVNGEVVVGQKTGRPPRTTPLWAALRDDLLAWQLHSGRRSGLVFPNQRGDAFTDTNWGNWSTRIWKPLRDTLGIKEPPYGLRHSYASLRIHEGASIPELAEELGHSPHMTLTTYAHVIHELRGAPRRSAAEEVAKARQETNQREPQLVLVEALG